MTGRPIERVLACGDTGGVLQIVNAMPPGLLCGLVAAEIRPQYLPELKSLSARLAVPLIVQVKVASSDYVRFVQQVKSLRPELIIVNSYAMLLREEILSLPTYGAVNVHGGLLPQYRGCNPIQWALLNNEVETGVTMHCMTRDFDNGDIIAQRRVPIKLEDTWQQIQHRLDAATEALLIEQVPKLLDQSTTRRPQDEPAARYYKRRKAKDGEFDWHRRVIDIYNLIRALVRPHPGAFCRLDGEKHLFEEYLTLQEVTRLKFSPLGQHMLGTDRIRLEPVGSVKAVPGKSPVGGGEPQDQVVAFRARTSADERGLCTVVLGGFDYRARICDLALRADDGAAAAQIAEAVRLTLEFAARELGLDRVSVRIDNTGVATGDVLQRIGEPWEKLPQSEEAVVLLSRG